MEEMKNQYEYFKRQITSIYEFSLNECTISTTKAEVIKRLDLLNDYWSRVDALQCKIQSKIEDPNLYNERTLAVIQKTYLETKLKLNELLAEFSCKKIKAVAQEVFKSVLIVIYQVEACLEVTSSVGEAQVYLERLKRAWNKYESCQSIVDKLSQYEMLQSSEMNQRYMRVNDEIIKLIHRLTVPSNSTQPSTSRQTQLIASGSIPKSDADLMSFYCLFKSLVHDNPDQSQAQKLHYLQLSLKGSVASLPISLLENTDYNEIWSILTTRYQTKRNIINTHLLSLFDLIYPSNEVQIVTSVKDLLVEFNKHLRSLTDLGQPTLQWDSIMIFLVTKKLDRETVGSWELSLGSEEFPTFIKLQKFLDKRFTEQAAARNPVVIVE